MLKKLCDSFYYVAANVSFTQSTYFVNETENFVQVEMVLSNPSSNNVTVQITSSDMTATGKHSDCYKRVFY